MSERTEKNTPRFDRQYGELKWTARAKETSSSVYLNGRYPASIQALLEFTDNSFGYRNRDQSYATWVSVVIDKDRIVVTDFGSLGTDAEGIKSFAQIGETQDMGIGYRGGGAKFAAWYFGEDLEIHTKPANSEIEYSTKIDGFGDPKIEYAGMFAIDPSISPFDKEKGRFEIIVRRLKNAENLPHGANLRRVLSEVYRPVLAREEIDTRYPYKVEKRQSVDENGSVVVLDDKAILKVTTSRKTEQVLPLPIPLLPSYSEDLKVTKTNKGEPMGYWVGEMDTKDSRSKAVEPGIRFYYDGRLITIDYCGFDKRDPRLLGLVGEVYLDHIKDVKGQLSVNKSAGIDTQSEQWKRVMESMKPAISPLVEKILQRPINIVQQNPAFVTSALAEARKIVDLCIKELAKEGDLITEDDLRLLVGETKGQRPAIPRGGEIVPKRDQKPGKPWREQEGRTLPGASSDDRISRIRKSIIDRNEFVGFDDTALTSTLREIEEASKRSRVLQINNNNPLVQTALVEGELAVTRLVGEELIYHISREWSSDLDSFLKMRNRLRYQLGNFLSSTAAFRRLEASQK